MTIQDFTTVFRDCNVLTSTLQYSQMAGYRVAFDASNMIHKYVNKERTKYVETLELLFDDPTIDHLEAQATMYLIKSAIGFMQNGVTPIFVFDGKTPALKAEFAATKRADDASKKALKYKTAWSKVLEYRAINEPVPYDVVKLIRDNMDSRPRQDAIRRVRDILIALGIPAMQAVHEADHVCSRLVEDGIAVAAVTEDRDFLTHGCPRVITEYGGGKGTLICLADVLTSLNMSFSQFRDLCIMLGTDYNNRIRGYGPVKSLNKMRQWISLDHADIDVSSLNHHAVRNEFKSRPLSELIDPTIIPRVDIYDIDIDRSISLLTTIDLDHYVTAVEASKSTLMSLLTDGAALSVPAEYSDV